MESDIIQFRIVYSRQKPSYKRRPISEFYRIESELSLHLHAIQTIAFYFNTTHFAYPYGIHPIILQRCQNRFAVIFYHYYNAVNQLVGITVEQAYCDYRVLCSFLQHSSLLPFIDSPFVT